jgi:hypothetical protein
VEPQEFFKGHPLGVAAYTRVRSLLEAVGDVEVRVTKSQLALRRRRGFAYLWMPGRYLKNPDAEVVLSIVLQRHEHSRRFKEVAHPSPGLWIHHLELGGLDEIDDEVEQWLREAAALAG